MRIDELFHLKFEYLELITESNDKPGYFYYKAATFNRTNDGQKTNENSHKRCAQVFGNREKKIHEDTFGPVDY